MAGHRGASRASGSRRATAALVAAVAVGAAVVVALEWRTTALLVLDGLVILAVSLGLVGAVLVMALLLRPLVIARPAAARHRTRRAGSDT